MTTELFRRLASGATSPDDSCEDQKPALVGDNLARCRKKSKMSHVLLLLAILYFCTQTVFMKGVGAATSPFTCPSGYTEVITSTQKYCVICPAGKYCSTPSAAATNCALPNYSGKGQASCSTAVSGWKQPTATTVLPTACIAGQIGGTSCTNCSGKNVCPGDGSSSTCAVDQAVYKLTTKQTACRTCVPGKICTAADEAACATGHRAFSEAAGTCLTTAAGSFAALYMTTKTCPTGSYSASGATTCTLCPANSSCTTSAATACAAATPKSGAGVAVCTPTPTTAYKQDYTLCAFGSYRNAAKTGCTACLANQWCSTGGTTATCPTTEKPMKSGTSYVDTAFLDAASKGTCAHVPVGTARTATGTTTSCTAATQNWDPTTALCSACTTNAACSATAPPGQILTCQLTQYFDNTAGKCKNCDQNAKVCGSPTSTVSSGLQQTALTNGLVTYSSSTPLTFPGDGKAQAEGIPAGACVSYTDGRASTRANCAAGDFAVYGRNTYTCTTFGTGNGPFLIACDISHASCPATPVSYGSSPYYYCKITGRDKERNGNNAQQNCNNGGGNSQTSWFGQSCSNCPNPGDLSAQGGMDVVGNQCDIYLELNDIPCKPGFENQNGNGGCQSDGGGNGNLYDGQEIAFGVQRQCFSVKTPGGTTITSGSVQRGSLTGISGSLPEYQCRDCPENQSCGLYYNVWCWGQELPLSCYKGIGTIPAGKTGAGQPCPKNLHLDDRRLQRNDGAFCQDANAKYHRDRLITFAAHYFLDHNDDTKQYIKCPFQTKSHTVSRHILWDDDCAAPNASTSCWSITNQAQTGVDGEQVRPKGSTATEFAAATKEGETPKRNSQGNYRTTHDTAADYDSKVWFMDNLDNTKYSYEYPYCKVDTNYFDYSVVDGHKKNSWEANQYTFTISDPQPVYGTNFNDPSSTAYPLPNYIDGYVEFEPSSYIADHVCSSYEFMSPNYPMCRPNLPGFISQTAQDTSTEKAVGEAIPGSRTQYITVLENKGASTGIKLMDCPQFMNPINGYEGGASAQWACRIGEKQECIKDTSDFCHSGQDFMCPQGMKKSGATAGSTVNDCVACSAGSFCGTGETGTCPDGYNCPAYTVDMTMLPSQPGSKTDSGNPTTAFATCQYEYCPGATSFDATKYCPRGFYNNFAGFSDNHYTAASCSPNPAGSMFLALSSTVNSSTANYQTCSAGSYCPEGTDGAIQCPTGSYSAAAADSLNLCIECTAGSFCAQGSSALGGCAAGHYCPKQTFFKYEYTCPVGKTVAGSSGQSTEASCSTSCAAGSYCREGADAAVTTLCDAANYVCPSGLMRTTCAAGSYTESGSTAANSASCTTCPAGSFCVGNGPKQQCPPGYWQANTGQSTCNPTSGGGFTTVAGSSTQTFSADGNWALTTGDVQSTKCEYGYTCATQVMTLCPVGKYCPLQSATTTNVSAGSIQNETGLWFDKPCPSGQFCAAGAAAVSVLPGTYSHQQQAAGLACADGFNCPTGSIGSKMQPCAQNTWYLSGGACTGEQCCTDALCPAENYCIHGMMKLCPFGFYCPDVSASLVNIFEACPMGTYKDVLGKSLVTDCTLCTGGFGCVQQGAAATSAECGPGYYCNSASPSTTPLIYCIDTATGAPLYDSTTYQCGNYNPAIKYGVCPIGYYCAKGTAIPDVCPSGTFSGAFAVRSLDECITCLKGYYCSGATAFNQCQPGTVCPLGSSSETNIVDAGYWSDWRYPEQIKCPPGSTMAATDGTTAAQHTCTITPQGTYAELFALDAPRTCLAGHDCSVVPVDGIVYPRMCEFGEYALDAAGFGACTSCQQHSYCAQDALTVADLATNLCPSGYECEIGANNQFMNFYKADPADLTIIPQAHNMDAAATNYLCPRGKYCDATTTTVGTLVQVNCPAGTYMPAIGSPSLASCVACPPGYNCNAAGKFSLTGCASGSYCPVCSGAAGAIAGVTACTAAVAETPCTAGHFCSANAGAEYSCNWGYYQDLTGQTVCKVCTAGSLCNGQTLTAVSVCPDAHYCPISATEGAAVAKLCSEGSLIPTGVLPLDMSLAATEIPLVTPLAKVLNPSLSTQCVPIDKNHWYRSPGVDNAATPANLFGDLTDGYFNNGNTGAKDAIPDAATVCDAGFFCVKGDRFPCTNGKWCNNRLRTTDGDLCPAGYYCVQAMNTKANLLTGTHFKALIRQFCPPGYACYEGASTYAADATKYAKCLAGTYSSAYGLTDTSECHDCPEGYVCDVQGMTWADVNVQAKYCPAGFYCGAKVDSSATTNAAQKPYVCTVGSFCPEKSMEKWACEGGTYTDANQQSACQNCLAGTYCPWTPTAVTTPLTVGVGQKTTCPKGHKCSANQLHQPEPCPAGYYQDVEGQVDCKACPAKFYCPLTGMDTVIACPDTMKCPANSIQPIQCQDGQNCDALQPSTQDGIEGSNSCPAGYFCKMGKKFPCYAGYICTINSVTPTPTNNVGGYICPKGQYCPQVVGPPVTGALAPINCAIGFYNPSFGAESIADCRPCQAGFSCENPGSTFQKPNTCPTGYICDQNANQFQCNTGFYCPAGAVAMIPCEDGTYQDEVGKTTCKKCPAGSYCKKSLVGGVITGATIGIACPKGFYCPESTPYEFTYPCPPGTYSDSTGYKNQNQILNPDGTILYAGCLPCQATFYCPNLAMVDTDFLDNTFKCKAGYLCDGGNSKAIGNDLCPVDKYCIEGAQLDCPDGKFIPVQGASSSDECVDCPPGKICPTHSVGMRDCPEGYYCDAGGYYNEDQAGIGGGFQDCQPGYYCPKGSFQPQKCKPGTYNDLTNQKECKICPIGNYCKDSGMTTPTPCDNTFLNWSCPAGSIYPKLCSIGETFDSTTLECVPCPFGKYCWPDPATWTANVGIQGDCDFAGGYVCRSGSWSPKPQIKNLNLILAGSSLFENYNGPVIRGHRGDGSGGIVPCQVGYFQPSAYTSECSQCMQGRYCPTTGMFDLVEYKCKGGYTCSKGKSIPNPQKCPKGYQCPSKAPRPLICEEGFYSDKEGLVVCEPCLSGFFCKNQDALGKPDPENALQKCIKGSNCFGANPRQPNCPDGLSLDNNECKNCTGGSYCRGGQVAGQCAAGYVCNKTAISDPNPSGYECPAGQYCSMGAIQPMPCPFKTMSIADKQRKNTDCRGCQPGYVCEWGDRDYYPCPAGSWCPQIGDMRFYRDYEYKCPPGTYNPERLKQYQADCLQCDEGYFCPNEGMKSTGNKCPKGHFCPLGSIQPRQCRPGTYIDFEGAVYEDDCLDCPTGYFCPEACTDPIECKPGQMCDGNTAIPKLCPGGFFCNKETQFRAEACQPNYYCPQGSGQMIPCKIPYICGEKSEIPVLCGPGYQVKSYDLEGVQNECLPCPAGYFSNLDQPICRPCTPGYVCYGKTNTPYPTFFKQDNGEVCPAGHFCPIQSSKAIPCPVGTYNPLKNQESEDRCLPCPMKTYNDKLGAVGCKPCGQFATSVQEAETCTCIGQGRLYSLADASCRCQSGFDFKDASGVSLAQASSIQDCFPVVLDRCTNYGNGTDYVRAPSGECKRYDDCAASCGGEPGVRSSVTGVCTCSNQKDIDVTCNQDCRKNAAKVEFINSYQVNITQADGTVETVSLNDVGDFYGSVCAQPPCTSVSVEIGKTGFNGVYDTPQLVKNQLTQQKKRRERLLVAKQMSGSQDESLNKTATGAMRSINGTLIEEDVAAYERRRLQQLSDTGVKNPVYCLPINEIMQFSVPNPSHYPVYMRDSVLNSNPEFDYGQFLYLEQQMKRKQATGDLSPSVFAFQFTEKGNYVFHDSADPDSMMLVSVKGKGETCSDPDRYIQSMSSESVAQTGVSVKDTIIQRPNYALYGSLIGILVLCTAISLVMIGYCLRKRWKIEDLSMDSYRANQLKITINHENDTLYDNKNDFVNYKSELIADEEDDLDNFNLDIQTDIMDSGKRYLKLYTKKKNKVKKFKISRRERLNQLVRIVDEDLDSFYEIAEEKKMRYLDMDKIHLLDETQIKEEITKELEAQQELQKIEDEQYAKRKEEMMQDASKRDVAKYQEMLNAMKERVRLANKELNSAQDQDMNDEDIKKRRELAIHDNGDINSKANILVFRIENDKNLTDEERENLLRAHDEAMLELKIAMDSDRKKQEKELDKALQEKLARRKRVREEQYKKQIKQEQGEAEKEIDLELSREKADLFENISQKLDKQKAELKDLPTDLLKKRIQLYEADADDEKRAVDREFEQKRKDLVEKRRKEIAQKYLTGAENDDDLKEEIRQLLVQFGGNAVGQQVLEQAEAQKRDEEERLKDRIKQRREMQERTRQKDITKLEQDIETCDIEAITELEQKIDEAYLKKKLKEAFAKRFSKKQDSNPNTERDTTQEIEPEEQKPLLSPDEQRKIQAKQKLFDITKNLDTALEQKSLLSQLQQTEGEFAEALQEQQSVADAKLAKRRELLKARRKNKQMQELDEQRLKDKIDLIEFEQAEKQKLTEEYIRSLFKKTSNSEIESPEQKAKRLELLNEFLSDQFLERLSGLLMKQFLEKDQSLKNLMQKYIDLNVAEVSHIQANFKIDMDALDAIEGFDPAQLTKVKQNLMFNEKAIINEVQLRLQNAQKEEEAALVKTMEDKHTSQQVEFREQMAKEHAAMRQQVIGENEMVSKEDNFDQQALHKYEQLKKDENKRREQKIELEKKKLAAEFEAELNEKYKDYDDMVQKLKEKEAEMDKEVTSMKARIQEHRDLMKQKAAQFQSIDTNEIMKELQRNADSIEGVISLEQREQFFKMKQKLDVRRKQVKRAKEAKQEAEKSMQNQSAATVVMGKFGKFLKQRHDQFEDVHEDDSLLLKRLKQWKQRKQDYLNELAGDLSVDMEKDQIHMMIVKLMTIETQIKEIKAESRKKASGFASGVTSANVTPSRGFMGGIVRAQSTQKDGLPVRRDTINITLNDRRNSTVMKSALRTSKPQVDTDSNSSYR